MNDRVGCARVSEDLGEDLAGTASNVHRWLLVEQAGPWGANAPLQSRLPSGIAVELLRLARHARARVLLIRRPGRDRRVGPRRAYVAVTRTRTRWLEQLSFTDPAELLTLDFDALTAEQSVGGCPVTDPLFLVCTNGAHDACCAERGRPLAAALAQVEPEATWESSHFGGDRFAGNLVCLPSGNYYGRVLPPVAAEIARAERIGRVHLENLRGRAALPFPIQAAEIALRRVHGLHDLDAVHLERHERLTDGRLALRFGTRDGGAHEVRVESRYESAPRALSCGGAALVAPRYIVTDVCGALIG